MSETQDRLTTEAERAEGKVMARIAAIVVGRDKRITELERAHDKAIKDGIEIVRGRDERVAKLEAQITAAKETTNDPYVFVVETEDGKKPMPFVSVADVLAALEQNNGE